LGSAPVSIFGPYQGKLDNSEESLELKMPDLPDPDGDVAYVLVDKVHYLDQPPWPVAADGIGFSLQRLHDGEYGDDVANWAAAGPTPGTTNTFGAPLTIDVQPQSQSVSVSSNAVFTVAVGGGPFLYQWLFNDQILPGATNADLVLTNVQAAASGGYRVLVRNSTSWVESQVASLTVLFPFQIGAQPQSRNVRLSSLTNVLATNVSFFVAIIGGSDLKYQWSFNGTNIPNATNSIYTLTTVSLADSGVFQVLVSDGVTSILSAPATLSVLAAPFLTQGLPSTTTALQGEDVTWTVSVTGFPPPFNFQWRRGSVPLTNIMQNSTTSSFTLHNVQLTNAVLYRVVITNVATGSPGLAANSASTLTVLADSDGDHIWDDWELRYGFKLNDPTVPGGDPDHDGMTTLQEYLAGTDPTNALSVLKLQPIGFPGAGSLSFGAVSNKSYSVQYKSSLADTAWSKLADIDPRSSNWTATVLDPGTNTTRYYRIVTPRQ